MSFGFGSDQVFVISRSGSGHVLIFDISYGVLSKKPELEIWKPLCGLKEFSCVSFKHYVFIFGGYSIKLKRCVEQVKRYDITTKKWLDFPPMSIDRRMSAATVFKNEIIICGGFKTNNKLLKSTEILNIKKKKWRKSSQMKKALADHQLVVIGDSVIGIGGVQEVLFKNEYVFCGSDDMYEYKDITSGWQTLDENIPLILSKPAYLHVTVTMNSKIYILGGLKTVINNDDELSEVVNEKVESISLNPRMADSSNVKNIKEWFSPWDRSLPSPAISRYGAAAICMEHDFYLIGGTSRNCLSGVEIVEKFHSKSLTWTNDFEIKHEVDLSMVCGVKIFGSKYKLNYDTGISSTSLLSTSVISEDEEEKSSNEKRYRVGWVLW